MENTEQTTELMPVEIKELATKVNAEKQAEVQKVLNDIFEGTASWEKQVDAIEVKDINDTMAMEMADVAGKHVKKARINAEKIFDAKREEVQNKMIDFKTEDSLWLKAKQITQIKLKAIQEKAEFKAKYAERFDAEQKALRTQIRVEKVAKFSTMELSDFEHLSEEGFNVMLSGLEKAHNEKIEAENKDKEEKLAKEKAEKEEKERVELENKRLAKEKEELEAKAKADKEAAEAKLAEERKIAEEKAAKAKAESDKKLAEERAKSEAAKKEAEAKAKKEAEIKEAELAKEREEKAKAQAELKAKTDLIEKRNIELRPYIVLIRNYDKLLNSSEEEYQKELSDIKRGERERIEFEKREAEKRYKEMESRGVLAKTFLLENGFNETTDGVSNQNMSISLSQFEFLTTDEELNEFKNRISKNLESAKRDAELKSMKEAEEKAKAEEVARLKSEEESKKKELKAPVKKRLNNWVDCFIIRPPEGLENDATVTEITNKFNDFKKWAKTQIDKI